jgi:hypothetical protein
LYAGGDGRAASRPRFICNGVAPACNSGDIAAPQSRIDARSNAAGAIVVAWRYNVIRGRFIAKPP